MKKTIRNKILRAIILLIVLIGLFELVYVFPEPFFNYHKSYKTFEFYSTEEESNNIDSILESVLSKIQFSEYYDSSEKYRIFYCPSGSKYHKIMFNINENYVYNSTFRHNILIFADVNFEENTLIDSRFNVTYKTDQCIAAGIVLNFVDNKQAAWMKSGYLEYISNCSIDYYDIMFLENVKTFYDNPDSARLINEKGISRPIYNHKARILIEFLILVKEMSYEEITFSNLPEEDVLKELTIWYDNELKTIANNGEHP